MMSPANGADTRNEPEPIYEQNENEDRGKEPERLLDQIASDHAFEKIVKAFHEPFPKILRSGRHRLDFARGGLREHNHSGGHDPSHEHRIRKREFPNVIKFSGLQRKRLVFFLGRSTGRFRSRSGAAKMARPRKTTAISEKNVDGRKRFGIRLSSVASSSPDFPAVQLRIGDARNKRGAGRLRRAI